MNFSINERLTSSSIQLGIISDCHVLMKNDSTFPWFMVIPQVEGGIEDLHNLPEQRFLEVMQIIRRVSAFVEETFKPEKLNVGCIGNIVRQMHIHIIGRNTKDPVWPGVVWGATYKNETYSQDAIEKIQNSFSAFLYNDAQSYD